MVQHSEYPAFLASRVGYDALLDWERLVHDVVEGELRASVRHFVSISGCRQFRFGFSGVFTESFIDLITREYSGYE